MGSILDPKPVTKVAADATYAPISGSPNYDTAGAAATAAAGKLDKTATAAYWAANTAYVAGQKVISPLGDIVSAVANFTSGASYDATKWKVLGSAFGDVVPLAAYLPVGRVPTDDDTAAFHAAWKYCASNNGRPLYIAPGTYNYNGTGLFTGSGYTADKFIILGSGPLRTTINLGASSYLVDVAAGSGLLGFEMRGIATVGGLGVFRSLRTAGQVGGQQIIDDFSFTGYSQAAIEANGSDWPYWRITNGVLQGGNYDTTIGVAFSGLTDGNHIRNVAFLANRIHVKMRQGGNNAYISNCDFIKFSNVGSSPRIDVWVVPNPGSVTNAGSGLVISDNKFGNENLKTGDYRIVYADEDTVGTTNGTKFPLLTTASTGYISGHTIRDNLFNGNSSATGMPLVFSTTPNVSGVRASGQLAGTLPSHILQFLNAPGADRTNLDNIIGPFTGVDVGTETASPLVSNGYGVARLIDPNEMFAGEAATHLGIGASDPVGYKQIVTKAVSLFTAGGTATMSAITDAHGGTDAATITLAASGDSYRVGLDGLTSADAGKPVWIEFDLRAGSVNVLRPVLQYTAGGAFHWAKVVRLGAGWTKYRFKWVPRERTAAVNLWFQALTGVTGTFDLGRVRVYQSREPLNVDGVVLIGQAKYKLSVSGGVVNAVAVP